MFIKIPTKSFVLPFRFHDNYLWMDARDTVDIQVLLIPLTWFPGGIVDTFL